jgi:hypothetical protein
MTGTFEGLGTLQFTPDNKLAYAYSGSKDISSEQTMLNFDTNSEYLEGRFEFNADFSTGGGAGMRVQIFLNDIMIVEERDTSSDWNTGDNEFHVIVPPFTNVKVKCLGGAQDANVNFTAKVYGAIQQTNLEAISDGSNWIKK